MTTPNEAARWLARAERDGTSPGEALAMFDRLPPVPVEGLRGQWIGGGLHTGHPLDGLLEAFGWYGKAFDDAERVHPLLFRAGQRIVAIEPRWIPLALASRLQLQRRPWAAALFGLARPILTTTRPAARLRAIVHREVTTAAMIYDRQPIIDVFREIAPGSLLGLMDVRGQPPMFFTLRRAV